MVSVCKAQGEDLVSICKQSKTESPEWILALVFAICLIFFFFLTGSGAVMSIKLCGPEKGLEIESPETCYSKQVGPVVRWGTYNFHFHSIPGPPCIWESENNNKIKAGSNKKCDPWGTLLSCASVSQISYLLERLLPFPALPGIPLSEGAWAGCETDPSSSKWWGWQLYKETLFGMGFGSLLHQEADFYSQWQLQSTDLWWGTSSESQLPLEFPCLWCIFTTYHCDAQYIAVPSY